MQITHELNIFQAHGVKEIYLGQIVDQESCCHPHTQFTGCWYRKYGKQVKSIKVGQEGGTNQAKMIKIDTANGRSPSAGMLVAGTCARLFQAH